MTEVRAWTDRVGALRALIDRVEAGEPAQAHWRGMCEAASIAPSSLGSALMGSLDAVARLEEPLRGDGWLGPDVRAPTRASGTWHVAYQKRLGGKGGWHFIVEEAAPEAHARLLGVLRAHLRAEEHSSNASS